MERELVDYALSPGACGVGACARLLPSLSGPGGTSGQRTDRIPSTRPSWRDRQHRELKKLFFSPPSKCAIDLFGPVLNRTILTQLHVASRSSLRNPRRRSATPRLESKISWRPDSNLQSSRTNLQSASRWDPQSPMPVLGYAKPKSPSETVSVMILK